jgi:hypothetical protein
LPCLQSDAQSCSVPLRLLFRSSPSHRPEFSRGQSATAAGTAPPALRGTRIHGRPTISNLPAALPVPGGAASPPRRGDENLVFGCRRRPRCRPCSAVPFSVWSRGRATMQRAFVRFSNYFRVCHADPALREKHLALPFLGGKAQSEILRSAPLRSE